MFTEQRTATAALPASGGSHTCTDLTVAQVLLRYCAIWAGYSIEGGFLLGVYPMFLHARGLEQFQINSVLAVYVAITFLTDVPTVAIADALGRRRSFMLGCALRSLAFLVYFFAYHYPMFIVGETIDGVGTTFCNGSIDAWGVDALDQAGYRGLKDRLFSRISQLMNFGFMLSAIAGAYVADHNIAWPWLLGATGYLLNAMLIARLMRENVNPHASAELRHLPRLIIDRIGAGIRRGFTMRTLLLLSLAQAVYFAAWAPYWLEWPQFFNQSFGVGVWLVGWLYALFTIARMLGAELMIWTMATDRRGRANRLSILAVALAAEQRIRELGPQRQLGSEERVRLGHGGFGAIPNVSQKLASKRRLDFRAVDVFRGALIHQEHVARARPPGQVDVLAHFDEAIGAEDGHPAIAKHLQSAGGEPVQTKIAGPTIAPHQRVAEVFKLGMLRIRQIADL